MSIEIKAITLGAVATNAYLVGDTDRREAILIDPVDDAPTLAKLAEDAGWSITLILATHAHFDHVLASADLKAMTGAPFALHREAAAMLPSVPESGLLFFGHRLPEPAEPDRLLEDGPDWIEVGAIRLQTLYTPGHAPGHLSFYMPDAQIVFSGDSLFAGSIGRTDLPGGDYDLLMQSITQRLMTLDDAVRVLPGHGQFTTIGRERQTNPFLLQYNQAR